MLVFENFGGVGSDKKCYMAFVKWDEICLPCRFGIWALGNSKRSIQLFLQNSSG